MLCGLVLFDKPSLAGVVTAVSASPPKGLSVIMPDVSLPAALPYTVDTEVMLRLRMRAADNCRG